MFLCKERFDEINVLSKEKRGTASENMDKELIARLREFMDDEARSCSMDSGCITPEYVYRMWGGAVALEEIEAALEELRNEKKSVTNYPLRWRLRADDFEGDDN